MANEKVNITSPVGRFVMGSLYKPRTTDFDGKPLVYKTGQNAGQPRVDYFIALAIPKTGEAHWGHTPWGAKIWQVGCTAFPQASQRPDFAWKIDDGDSIIPNKRNRRPCDNEGWKGHWILKMSGGYAPKVYKVEGNACIQVTEPDFLKPGYYMEVAFNVDGNSNQNNPGIYLNHSMVCFRGFGAEIQFGPNVEEAGFGASPLPAGASAVPLASSVPLPGMPPAPPAYPGGYQPPPAPAMPPAPPAAPVYPNPGFLQIPPAPASQYPPQPVAQNAAAGFSGYATSAPISSAQPGALTTSPSNVPPAPPMAPAAPSYRMTEKAAGATREAFLAAGWDDARLIQQGFMLP